MKSLTLFCLLSLSSLLTLHAQTKPYFFSDTLLSNAGKLDPTTPYECAATYLSFIGEYAWSLAVWDSIPDDGYRKPDSQYLARFRPVDAHKYILERARRERIIMINEAHHIPGHRVFTESLLKDLYKLGFRYFGAETLDHNDTLLASRKYPVLNTGYYSDEPCYGNLIRTALHQGFQVFPYEFRMIPGANWDSLVKKREVIQAQNILRILQQDSSARIIIHCGYGHNCKDWGGNIFTAMAGWVKELSGIEPFTIGQDWLTEKSAPQYENALYRYMRADKYSVFIDTKGKALKGWQDDNCWDVLVYHPRTKWISGRPHWMFGNDRKPFFITDKITVSFPCLVYVYVVGEDIKDAVPADIIELKSAQDKKALALKRGHYNIVVKDKKGAKQVLLIEQK